MNTFIQRFSGLVKGVISGFDRIVFKGSILPLSYAEGVTEFCRRRGILNKDYKDWMMAQSAALIESVERYARRESGHPITPIASLHTDKEALARERQRAGRIEKGLVGVWSCVESGASFKAHFCAERGFPQLRYHPTHCKHLYLYFDHPGFGFMNIRLQTWLPYHIQICMNGREWLRRCLGKAGVGFEVSGNKFLHIADFDRAQKFLDRQLDAEWPILLRGFLPLAFPTMEQTLGPQLSYYWTLWQSEWATDLIFPQPQDAESLMEALLRHAVITGTSARVLRYLGRPLTAGGQPHARFSGQVSTRATCFHEGVRVRHWVDQNSVKAYNEHNVLRFETTLNNPAVFQVWRHAQGQSPTAPKTRRPLRKGVADTPLRAQVSQETNDRFMNQMATLRDDRPVGDLLATVTSRHIRDGRVIRALEPTGKDRELLQAIADPQFAVSGMANAGLRQKLRGTTWAAYRTDRQLAARVTRHLRLLREHGLIRKTPNRRIYHLTGKGRLITTALNALLGASTQRLLEAAA
jgi:hypothetical protein